MSSVELLCWDRVGNQISRIHWALFESDSSYAWMGSMHCLTVRPLVRLGLGIRTLKRIMHQIYVVHAPLLVINLVAIGLGIGSTFASSDCANFKVL